MHIGIGNISSEKRKNENWRFSAVLMAPNDKSQF